MSGSNIVIRLTSPLRLHHYYSRVRHRYFLSAGYYCLRLIYIGCRARSSLNSRPSHNITFLSLNNRACIYGKWFLKSNDMHAKYGQQESPHEQQQSVLLSRIITNIVRTSASLRSQTRLIHLQEKVNEAVAMMNKNLQEVNIQNMNVELVAQMFKNYQSNVLFHLEGTLNILGAKTQFMLMDLKQPRI